MDKVQIWGIPSNLPTDKAAVFRSRLLLAYNDIRPLLSEPLPIISIGDIRQKQQPEASPSGEKKSISDPSDIRYLPQEPLYSFKQLILPEETLNAIRNAIELLKVEKTVFDDWGLRTIEPNPRVALNFYGPPGTGKTLAAHAIADYLHKTILIASYAEIESKYHGDGPKNVKAIFAAAEKQDAILFIDEADSLLSKRLLNVTQGSEQAINSMRSQLLICLEQFHGTVIFATNLIENYDKAFETRIQHIAFKMPDIFCREKIWQAHLLPQLPLAPELSCTDLAQAVEDVCGRDIKNAVIRTAVQAAIRHTLITQQDLINTIKNIKAARIPVIGNNGNLSQEDKNLLLEKAKQALMHSSATTKEDTHGR